jgi:sugar phosphate permease
MSEKADQSNHNGDMWARHGNKIRARRKLIWLFLSLAFLIVYFHRVSPAVIVDELFMQFNIEAAVAIGSLAGVYFWIYFLMQVPAGILIDVFGPRKVVSSGITVSALGAVWFGLAGSVAGLFAARFLVGLGVSVVVVSLIRVYSAWFRPYELGSVMGLTISTGCLGGILAATPLAAMVNLLGYRTSFVIIGLLSALVAALSWYIIRDEPREYLYPGQCPLRPAGGRTMSLAAIAGNILVIIRDRHLWFALAIAFCIYGPFMALAGVWGVPYLMQVYGLGRSEAASFNIITSVGLVLGGFSVGFISDRLNSRKKPLIYFTAGNLLIWAVLIWWNCGMPPLGILLAVFFLLGFFGNTGMLSTIVAKEYNPPEISGLASGIGNTGGFIGSAFVQPLFGYILDLKWDGAVLDGVKLYPLEAYRLAFEACFIICFLALVAALLLRESYREN